MLSYVCKTLCMINFTTCYIQFFFFQYVANKVDFQLKNFSVTLLDDEAK